MARITTADGNIHRVKEEVEGIWAILQSVVEHEDTPGSFVFMKFTSNTTDPILLNVSQIVSVEK